MESNQQNSPEQYGRGNDTNLNGFHPGSISITDIKAERLKFLQSSSEPESTKIPAFPIEAFPTAIQKIIIAANESLNYPVDFFGASILYAASLSIGNTHRIEVKRGWYEPALLFIANVGKPNTNKSHPLSFAIQPITDYDKKTYSEYERREKEYEQAISLSKKEREQLGMAEPVKPSWQKYIVQDFTPEALAEVHKFNQRGIGVYADELASWFKNFNRYHKGSEQEFWLTNWSGKQLTIDRKNGKPVLISFPFIPVAGNIQTGLLFELAKDNRAYNGFIDRLLYAFPEGIRKPSWSDKEINPLFIDNWNRIIGNLLNLPLQCDESFTPVPKILKFAPEALQKLKEWVKQNSDLCNSTENEALAGIYGKFDLHIVRLALILEMLRYACGISEKYNVGIRAVDGALKLVEYFQATARKVHSIISNFNPLDKLAADKRRVYEALPDNFTTAEGLRIAGLHDIPERTFKTFLNEKIYFDKIRHGEYAKRFF